MYATANLSDRYRNDAINSAGPLDLIIMLYDGCIKQIRIAALYEEEKNIEQRSIALGKAENILDELMRSLDLNFPIATDLLNLYEFMFEELIQANMTRDMTRLQPVIDMLTELKDAWKTIKTSTGRAYYEE